MAKSKNRGHREARKQRQELPVVPDLGRLAMPRKRNRAAAKYVAEIGPLWDRRRASRTARRTAIRRERARADDPRKRHLDKAVRVRLLHLAPSWRFDHSQRALVAVDHAPEHVDELVVAITQLGAEPITLRVSGLPLRAAARVGRALPDRSQLVMLRASLEHPPRT